MAEESNGKLTTISEKTKVSLAVVGPIFLVMLGGGLWLNNRLNVIDTKLNTLGAAIRTSWTVQNQKLWSDRLSWRNPTLTVPGVDEAVKDSRPMEDRTE